MFKCAINSYLKYRFHYSGVIMGFINPSLKAIMAVQPCFFQNDIRTDTRNPITLTQIKEVLKKNSRQFEDGFTCLSTTCTHCDEKNGALYINKITGYFLCTECQRCGSWDDFQSQIINLKKGSSQSQIKKIMLKDSSIAQEGHKKWLFVTESAKEFCDLSEDEVKQMCLSFNFDVLPDHLLRNLHIFVDSGNLYFPIRNIDKFIVGYKQLSVVGDEFSVPRNQCPGIIKYIPKKVKKKIDVVIIIHEVKDLIALSLHGAQYHVVCLPHGVTTLPQEVLPLLEQYKKVIIWFGNDAVALNSVPTLVKKLGEQRCFVVRATVTQPAAHKAFQNGQNIEAIINSAYPISHPSITTFAAFRQDILSELQNIDKAHGVKWKRFPKLNEILYGHRRGELTILTGPTGSGKTTFISEYSLDLAQQGVTTLWGSFEIRNQRLARTMLQQMVLLPLDKHLDQFDIWADQFSQLPLYFMMFHGPQPVRIVMETIEHATYVHDIGHVIIDNLQFMMGTAADSQTLDRFYKQDLIVAEFRQFATKCNCHVTLIIHPRKERETEELTTNSIFGGAKASQEADNILIIQHKLLQSLQYKKFLQVTKNRYTGDLGIMPLIFDKNGLSFAQKKKSDKVDKKIEHESRD